jgi:hypothetical protein
VVGTTFLWAGLGDAAAAAYSQQPPIPIIGFFPLSSVILQIPCSQKQSEKLLKKERKGREGKGREYLFTWLKGLREAGAPPSILIKLNRVRTSEV